MSLNNFGVVAIREKAELSRSAQPDGEGIATLKKLGVAVILKLNSSQEYPVSQEQAYCGALISVRETALDAFNPNETATRQLAAAIQEALGQGKGIHVHCSHGRDRTGLVIGAWQLLYGGRTLKEVMDGRAAYGTNWVIDIPDHEIVEMLEKFAKERGVA